MTELEASIKQLAGTFDKDIVEIIACEVVSVDVDTRTCTVKSLSGKSQTEISGVMLMAEVSDGLFQVPKVESTVIVGLSTTQKSLVLMTSDVETMALIGDELGGLVKVIPLTTKLNNLENKVNSIIGWANSHTHICAAPTLASGPAVPQVTGTLTPTDQAEIENVKIKHGE